jgi:hypothetical protein
MIKLPEPRLIGGTFLPISGFEGYDMAENRAQTAWRPIDDIVAGALYDFLGYLTTRRTRITMSDRDEVGPAVDALVDWSKTRKINLDEARVKDWDSFTSPHTKPIQEHVNPIRTEINQREKAVLGPPHPRDFGIPKEHWEATQHYANFWHQNRLAASAKTGLCDAN